MEDIVKNHLENEDYKSLENILNSENKVDWRHILIFMSQSRKAYPKNMSAKIIQKIQDYQDLILYIVNYTDLSKNCLEKLMKYVRDGYFIKKMLYYPRVLEKIIQIRNPESYEFSEIFSGGATNFRKSLPGMIFDKLYRNNSPTIQEIDLILKARNNRDMLKNLLEYSLSYKDYKMADYLIDKKANVNDLDIFSLLNFTKDKSIVRYLSSKNIDLNRNMNLYNAIVRKNINYIQVLLENKADPNIDYKDPDYGIVRTAVRGDLLQLDKTMTIIRLLDKYGADFTRDPGVLATFIKTYEKMNFLENSENFLMGRNTILRKNDIINFLDILTFLAKKGVRTQGLTENELERIDNILKLYHEYKSQEVTRVMLRKRNRPYNHPLYDRNVIGVISKYL